MKTLPRIAPAHRGVTRTPGWGVAALLPLMVLFLAACDRSKSEPATASAGAPKYYCPMHPTYTSDRMGDCPICNMKLVPVRPGGVAANTNGPAVEGRALIMVTPERQQLIGLRTSTVFPRLLTQTLRTTGVLEHDETSLARIAPRFGGWVRKLHVNFTGQEVAAGQPLLTAYSPELMASENEYLIAWRRWQQVQHDPESEGRSGVEQLWTAARRRLELWEIGPEEIRALESRGHASDEVLLRAPISGHVISKPAVEGKAFMAGETLYELGTLRVLWVRATIPEAEVGLVKTGQQARVSLPHLPGQSFETEVDFVYPHIEPATRRAEVRLKLPNPRHELRPDMWALVELELDLGERLTVPASAVIDTGTRQLAFVRREDDHLEPREVTMGVRTDDWWEVIAGLKEGEKVVTRALFLVDSESQLRAAVGGP